MKIIAGARLSNWKYKSENDKGNREFNNELAPYIGAIYDFTQDHSVYASYTEIFKPQDRKDVNDQYIDPITGKSYETGLKSEWFGGRLNTALSVFRIEQSNFAELIPGVFIIRNGTQTTEQAYRAVDGVESKGFEFEADGKLTITGLLISVLLILKQKMQRVRRLIRQTLEQPRIYLLSTKLISGVQDLA